MTKLFDKFDFMAGMSNANAWLYLFPAIIAGLGLSYLSAFLGVGREYKNP